MGHEGESLLYLELGPSDYANAFIWNSLVVTARHVATESRTITVPADNESAPVSFEPHSHRDLAISHDRTKRQGFENVSLPHVGDEVKVVGHHGPERLPFEIAAKVIEILEDERIVIERYNGKLFQAGMSGSPALSKDGSVIGVLVRGADEAGQRVILEPATALVR